MGTCSMILPSVIILYSSSRAVFPKGQGLSMSIHFEFSVYKLSDMKYERDIFVLVFFPVCRVLKEIDFLQMFRPNRIQHF